MDKLLYLVGPLGCAVAMVLCMGMMAKGMRHRGSDGDAAQTEDIAALRAEVARLRAEQPEPADG